MDGRAVDTASVVVELEAVAQVSPHEAKLQVVTWPSGTAPHPGSSHR
jgi:hypothetical protein